MVERAYLHLMFRTSQARFRWWLTVDRPKATLDIIPGPYKVGPQLVYSWCTSRPTLHVASIALVTGK